MSEPLGGAEGGGAGGVSAGGGAAGAGAGAAAGGAADVAGAAEAVYAPDWRASIIASIRDPSDS